MCLLRYNTKNCCCFNKKCYHEAVVYQWPFKGV
nr:MAG TPA: hypothetical protein [Caudoviricetes sp.]